MPINYAANNCSHSLIAQGLNVTLSPQLVKNLLVSLHGALATRYVI